MTAMAQENAEKVANAKKAAADAERRAAARQLEDNLAERMEKLQARLGHAPHLSLTAPHTASHISHPALPPFRCRRSCARCRRKRAPSVQQPG